jgi:A/G-specific adenine glycosylase
MKRNKVSLSKFEKDFIKAVWEYYETSGRHDLPWRKTRDPYKILVSEVMLQQTQVTRVIPKYRQFLKMFPTVRHLAEASLGAVLLEWQGLGYNRRAKFLWQAAQVVTYEYKGVWPKTFPALRLLPGVGHYTAGAVMNFAYNMPIPIIETNVRTVYIHHFFHEVEAVFDKELQPLIDRTLDMQHPREWNWALMDYGSFLKSTVGNKNKKSSTYKKQSAFRESDRYIRGAIIRELAKRSLAPKDLENTFAEIDLSRLTAQITALLSEGLVVLTKGRYRLP